MSKPKKEEKKVESPVSGGVHLREYERLLPVKLTDQERRAIGDELAGKDLTIEELERELTDRSKDLRARIKVARNEQRKLSATLRAGEQERMVRVAVYGVGATNEGVIVRLDTLATVEKRALSSEERQGVLDFETDGPDAKARKEKHQADASTKEAARKDKAEQEKEDRLDKLQEEREAEEAAAAQVADGSTAVRAADARAQAAKVPLHARARVRKAPK